MNAPKRIRNVDSYRDGQPDLDVYNGCFDGYASAKFCGSDLDGLFVAGLAVHGVWERSGYFLVLEHKAHPKSWSHGQWLALNALSELNPRRLLVVVTYGEEPNRPHAYQSLPLHGWQEGPCAEFWPLIPIDWADVESLPLRRWIRSVADCAARNR